MHDLSRFSNRAEAFEAHDDVPTSPPLADAIGNVILRRYSRRSILGGCLGVAAATALFGPRAALAATPAAGDDPFAFDEIAGGVDERHHLAPGYRAQILLRWGDPVFIDAPAFDPNRQTAEAQRRQFGYNNDFVGFVPLDPDGRRGLLCVNHEYTNEEVMFPGVGRQDVNGFQHLTAEQVGVEMAAHGATVIEIARDGADWRPVLDSRYNRRITAGDTEMTFDGPAAGHARLKTTADPSGTRVVGTLNNCAGGMTPWGTYLAAEENFHGYFWTDRRDAKGVPEKGLGGNQAESYARYDVPTLWQAWGKFHDRFNTDREPNEPNRFGWIVEIDPLDAASTPVKHTALGRFRHEGAEALLNADGQVVLYSGDDARFDYVYRFVSTGRFDPAARAANMRLLSDGVLSVARFDADGTVHWLPLVHGEGPLTVENGFPSQAEILIDARLAADALGATRMDRPEDVQANPVTGKVIVIMTNNDKRSSGQINAANPRAENRFGHIIEMTPPGGDHAAATFRWDILVRCGDPSIAEVGAVWNPETSKDGWFASPDNCAFDAAGRLWIATDQGNDWAKTGRADGLYALGTEGASRGRAKLFFRVPVGAELCGPCFTPDQETLFVAVQHPGTDGTKDYAGFNRASTFDDPATRWPDFAPGMPPRPAIVAITREGGGKVADERVSAANIGNKRT